MPNETAVAAQTPTADRQLAVAPRAAIEHAVRFRFVDALRGIAALCVAWHHIDLYGPLSDPAATVMPGWLKALSYYGWGGVPTFFVISGFVIAYSVRGAWVTPRFLGNFALRRSLRLDPSYWTMIGLVLFLHFLPEMAGLPSPHEVLSPGQVLTHFAYLQNVFEYENLSAGFWTLCIEMQFYLLFCLLLGLAQRLSGGGPRQVLPKPAMSALVFLPLAVASLFVFNLNESYDDWIVYFFGIFFLGSAAWWALEGRIAGWWFWAYAALVAVRFAWFGGADLPIALATAVSIYLVGRAGRLTTWLSWAPLQYLGRISYSLYLIHYPVAHIVVNAGYRLTGDAPLAACLWMGLSLGLSVLAAHFLYLLVEAPTARLASRLKRREPARNARPHEHAPSYEPSPANA